MNHTRSAKLRQSHALTHIHNKIDGSSHELKRIFFAKVPQTISLLAQSLFEIFTLDIRQMSLQKPAVSIDVGVVRGVRRISQF